MGDTGLEPAPELPEKQEVNERRGAKSGTVSVDLGFSAAVGAVMRLPLSDAEKAEAVRRLMR
jgi:hypothetical protein